MSQTPTPQASLPPPPGTADPEPSSRRTRTWALVAIVVVAALVAGLTAFAVTRGDSAEAQPLTLTFTEGQEQTYEIHQTIDAQLASDVLGEQRIALDVTQVVGWTVVSVDEEGVATIEVEVSEMSGTISGSEIPSTPIPAVEIVIAPDGRILSAGGLALGGAGQTQGFGFPGMGQLTPILPDEGDEVAVGDTWEKEFSQEFPFGDGTIEFSASSTYERNETVDGREAAVIVTDMSVPLDLTLDFGDLLEALGPELAGVTGAGELDALGDATIAYEGEGSFTQTSFVDLQAEELLSMQSVGAFDISMRFSGIPGIAAGSAEMDFTGDFTQELELR